MSYEYRRSAYSRFRPRFFCGTDAVAALTAGFFAIIALLPTGRPLALRMPCCGADAKR